MPLKYYKPFSSATRNKISIYLTKHKYNNKKNYSILFKKNTKSYKIKYKKINVYYYYKYYNILSITNIIILKFITNYKLKNNFVAIGFYLNNLLKGQYMYIIPEESIKLYDIISIGLKIILNKGNSMSLNYIPSNFNIFNIENNNKGSCISRSAGTTCTLLYKYKTYSIIKLPSCKFIKISNLNFATLGKNNNSEFKLIKKGKKYLKDTVIVRGVAKNAKDHPHGGGNNKSYVGCKYSMTPWNRIALGYKTLNKKYKTK